MSTQGEKKKQINTFSKICIGFALFLGLTIVFLNYKDVIKKINNYKKSKTSETSQSTSASTKTYNLNEKMTINNLEMTAYSFEDYNNDMLTKLLRQTGQWKDNYKAVSVDMEVKNTGNILLDEPALLSFSIKDRSNYEYRSAYITSGQREPMLYLTKRLQPQETIRGYLTFAVPKDEEPYLLVFEQDSANIQVNLK